LAQVGGKRMEGTVKFYNRKKGFGFVQGDDGKDYFVHFTALPQGVFLRDNDKVSFNASEGERGLKAEGVQLLEKGSEREDAGYDQEESEQSAEEPAQEEATEEPEAEAEEPAQEEATEEPEAEAEEPAQEAETTEESTEEEKTE